MESYRITIFGTDLSALWHFSFDPTCSIFRCKLARLIRTTKCPLNIFPFPFRIRH